MLMIPNLFGGFQPPAIGRKYPPQHIPTQQAPPSRPRNGTGDVCRLMRDIKLLGGLDDVAAGEYLKIHPQCVAMVRDGRDRSVTYEQAEALAYDLVVHLRDCADKLLESLGGKAHV